MTATAERLRRNRFAAGVEVYTHPVGPVGEEGISESFAEAPERFSVMPEELLVVLESFDALPLVAARDMWIEPSTRLVVLRPGVNALLEDGSLAEELFRGLSEPRADLCLFSDQFLFNLPGKVLLLPGASWRRETLR